jgi:anti-sigma factor ChrR (cupin superfamily)
MPDANIVLSDLFSRNADFNRFTWRPFREGVEISSIYNQPSGASAALLRYAPGASVPRHRHPAPEHIFILRGSQADERGVYCAGTMVVNMPNSQHAITSEEGCIVLAIWVAPVEFS